MRFEIQSMGIHPLIFRIPGHHLFFEKAGMHVGLYDVGGWGEIQWNHQTFIRHDSYQLFGHRILRLLRFQDQGLFRSCTPFLELKSYRSMPSRADLIETISFPTESRLINWNPAKHN
jgi:hypothetical protein